MMKIFRPLALLLVSTLHYIYQDNSCSQIRWTKNGTQEFTYDANDTSRHTSTNGSTGFRPSIRG